MTAFPLYWGVWNVRTGIVFMILVETLMDGLMYTVSAYVKYCVDEMELCNSI